MDALTEIKESLQAIRDEFIRDKEADAWKKAAAVSIVLIAVAAALGSQIANRYGQNVLASLTDSNLQQSLAANKWSYFQSKSINSHLYEIDREKIRDRLLNQRLSRVSRRYLRDLVRAANLDLRI